MGADHHAVAEYAMLATLARSQAWIDGLRPGLFGHPVTRYLFARMCAARAQTGMWSPYVVGILLERDGVAPDTVDDWVSALTDAAPISGPETTVRFLLGVLIERAGAREGKAQIDIAAEKRAAKCPLTGAEIDAILALRAAAGMVGRQ